MNEVEVKAVVAFWAAGKLVKEGATVTVTKREAKELVGSGVAAYVEDKKAADKAE